MNKLYTLIMLFLAQSICAVQEEQKGAVNPEFFNTDVVARLSRSDFEQHMVCWMQEYANVHLSCQNTDGIKYDELHTQFAIAESAQAHQGKLRTIKLMAAHMLSESNIEPMLQRLARKIPIAQKIPLEARAIGMPAACFALGFLLN